MGNVPQDQDSNISVTQKEPSESKVLMAMSGGLDSFVAATLLKSQGYNLKGVHLKLVSDPSTDIGKYICKSCVRHSEDKAIEMAKKIDLPLEVVDVSSEYYATVVDNIFHEYLQQRTPSPCIRCTRDIKFQHLYRLSKKYNCDYIATGYRALVQIEVKTGKAHLFSSTDADLDQSYYLYGLPQEVLQQLLVPLGGLSKDMIRKMAASFELDEEFKAMTPKNCYADDRSFVDLMKERVAPSLRPAGNIRTQDHVVVGQHSGMFQFRMGENMKFYKEYEMRVQQPEKYQVVGFHPEDASVKIGTAEDLMTDYMVIKSVHWLAPPEPLKGKKCLVKVGAFEKAVPCFVTEFEEGVVHVRLDSPLATVFPGKTAVFYQGSEVIGGGVIASAADPFVPEEDEEEKKKKPSPLE